VEKLGEKFCHFTKTVYKLEQLHLMSKVVKHPQHSSLHSVLLIRMQGKKVVSSTVILGMHAAWNLPSTTSSHISCCSAVTMPIKLSSYTTWSTSEMVASVQLPLNFVFFCLAEDLVT